MEVYLMQTIEEKIIDFMKNNNGMVKTSELKPYGVDLKKLQRMANSGKIERIATGLYLHSDFIEDEYYITSYRVPKGIFSYESSLYLHKLSDENPTTLTLTIPSGWNSPLLKDKRYTFYYLKKDLWSLGKDFVKTPFGNQVPVYSKERTLSEMISKIDKLDRDLVLNSLKTGVKNNLIDIKKLLDYADIFRCKNLTRAYIEVMI
jgi:possible transcriptional regulator